MTDSEHYQLLGFEFTPNQSGEVFCYIALLTHQDDFDNTDIYVDDLKIEEIGRARVDTDPRPAGKNLLKTLHLVKIFSSGPLQRTILTE